MSNANIRELIYGQEKRRISTATTLKQKLNHKSTLSNNSQQSKKRETISGHIIAGSSIKVS